MSLAHLTLPTREVENTAVFLERTLRYARDPVPDNIPCETVWLNIGRGQQLGSSERETEPTKRAGHASHVHEESSFG